MMRRFHIRHLPLGALLAALALGILAGDVLAATSAPEPIVIGLSDEEVAVHGDIRALLDPESALSVHAILAADDSLAWFPVATDVPRFGYSSATVWLHFRVLNNNPIEDLVFSLDQSVIDEMEYVQVADGRIVDHKLLGDAFPYAHRPISSLDLSLAAEFPSGWPQDVYLRLKSKSSIQAPMTLWTKARFYQRSITDAMVNGLVYGMILAIVAYGLVVFATLRDPNYLAFAGYTLVFMTVPFSLQGYSYKFLWPGSPWLQDHAFLIILPVLSVVSIVFARRVLDYPHHMKRVDRVIKGYALVKLVTIAPLLHFHYSSGIRYSMVTALADELFILGSGIYIWFKYKHRPAAYFSLAWVAFLVGTTSLVLNRFGLVSRSLYTEIGPALGIMSQALVMALGLSESVRQSRAAALNAEQALVKHRRESGRKLKIEVQRRTAELQQVMRQLARMNEEFEEANRLDGLTRVFNRSAFDDRLMREFQRASRSGSELTVIMIDIDHFKRFNDDHGHLVGDQCLVEVARTIDRTARRTDDFTARYGGEEFAVILVNTPHESALKVAERIRQAVERLDFRVDGLRVPVTVSLGACTVRPGAKDNPEAVVAEADAALYRAKHAGRNQVMSADAPAPIAV